MPQHLWIIYRNFWAHNGSVAWPAHIIGLFLTGLAIYGVREDRRHRMYHPRIYRETYYDRNDLEDGNGKHQ